MAVVIDSCRHCISPLRMHSELPLWHNYSWRPAHQGGLVTYHMVSAQVRKSRMHIITQCWFDMTGGYAHARLVKGNCSHIKRQR